MQELENILLEIIEKGDLILGEKECKEDKGVVECAL